MSHQTMFNLFIFTALECEAKPLIDFFALKKDTEHHAFSVYKNDTIVLTISGVGKTAMAGAVGYTMAVFLTAGFPVVVNIGIAGHKDLALGKLCLAMKLIDGDTERQFYPQFVAKQSIEFCVLKTNSAAITQYNSECLYDMEASAFYEIAVRFSSSELIHCFKIVSDNQNSAIDHINSKRVSLWISDQLPEIDRLLNCLLEQQQLVSKNELPEFDEMVCRWHFTLAGQLKLKALILRWKLLTQDAIVINSEKKMSAKEVLKYLEDKLDSMELHL